MDNNRFLFDETAEIIEPDSDVAAALLSDLPDEIKMDKGDFQGHPFRGNQWLNNPSFVEKLKSVPVYHGTSTQALARITKEGIRPALTIWERRGGNLGWAGSKLVSKPTPHARLCVSTSRKEAEMYASRVNAQDKRLIPVVIRIQVPKSKFEKFEKFGTERWSHDVIPPEWIRSYKVMKEDSVEAYVVIMVDGTAVDKAWSSPTLPDEIKMDKGDFQGHPFRGNQWVYHGTTDALFPESTTHVNPGPGHNSPAWFTTNLNEAKAFARAKVGYHGGRPIVVAAYAVDVKQPKDFIGAGPTARISTKPVRVRGIVHKEWSAPASATSGIQGYDLEGQRIKRLKLLASLVPTMVTLTKKDINYDPSEGVWRTLNGRRVFILHGENPTAALNRSLKHKVTVKAKAGGGAKDDDNMSPAARRARAKETHQRSTAWRQQYCEEKELMVANIIAKKVGGKVHSVKRTDDNDAVDIEVQFSVGGKKVGIEIKTMIVNKEGKITMHPSSLERKRMWTDNKNTFGHTVIIDDRGVFEDFDGSKPGRAFFKGPSTVYYSPGYGSPRVTSKNVDLIGDLKGSGATTLKDKLMNGGTRYKWTGKYKKGKVKGKITYTKIFERYNREGKLLGLTKADFDDDLEETFVDLEKVEL